MTQQNQPPVCEYCKVPMMKGVGINPTDPDRVRHAIRSMPHLINHEHLRLDPVWKCAKCGHSKDLVP